jgi:hypothetical protein
VCCGVLARARTRLSSVYPLGDRSRREFLVDEEVSNFEIDGEGLASSRRRRTHGTLFVRAIVVRRTRRTPRLTTSLGNVVPNVEEEGYSYLVRLLVVSRGSPIAPLALARCCWRSRANLDNFLGFQHENHTLARSATRSWARNLLIEEDFTVWRDSEWSSGNRSRACLAFT